MSESNFIYGETASGVVNGVNKTFVLTNQIDRIEEVYLGGAPYRGVSFTGDTITLADAPTSMEGSPVVDYWVVSNVAVEGSDITFGNIIDDVYTRLGQNRTSLQYPLSLVKSYIVEAVRVINNFKTNPLKNIGSYSFNKAPDFTTSSYSATQLISGAITSAVPNTGKVIVKYGEIVDYSGRVAGSYLENLTGLNVVYQGGDEVMVGYKASALVKKVSEVLLNRNPLIFTDRREFALGRTTYNYTIIDDFIFVPYSRNSNDIICVNYVRNNTEPSTESDLIDIERDYYHVISLYALYNIFMDREDDRWQIQEKKFQEQFKWYRAYLSKTTMGVNTRIPSRHLIQF